jgi:hypothetical protein
LIQIGMAITVAARANKQTLSDWVRSAIHATLGA